MVKINKKFNFYIMYINNNIDADNNNNQILFINNIYTIYNRNLFSLSNYFNNHPNNRFVLKKKFKKKICKKLIKIFSIKIKITKMFLYKYKITFIILNLIKY